MTEITLRCLEKKKREYATEIRKFALTLRFYSPRAYIYVLKKFGSGILPAVSTLREWACTQHFNPGFSSEVLSHLKKRSEEMNGKMLCNLVIDEISMRQQLIIKNKKRYGCVDLGFDGPNQNHHSDKHKDFDEEEEEEEDEKLPSLAHSSLVFMLVALNGSWKMPFAYFWINSLAAEQRAHQISDALRLLEENSVIVRSLTFDGAPVNLATARKLGANLNVLSPTFKPYFPHPSVEENVYIFLDPSHMIKNVRNVLGSTVKRNKAGDVMYYCSMYDADGQKISWTHLEDVVNLQTNEGLRGGNRLTKRHMKYRENPMNVALATQTLSNSSAAILRYLQKKVPKKFAGVGGTANYCENFNNAFDILNFRRFEDTTQYRKPLNLNTIKDLEEKANSIINYITGLKTHSGKPVVTSKSKCGFIGFIVCLSNIFSLFRDLNIAYGLEYLTTYKLLQDHLENFFCCIRLRGGFNNNPNAHQFACAYRALLQHTQIQSTENSNCRSFDGDLPILCPSGVNYPGRSKPDVETMETNFDGKFDFRNVYIPSVFVKDVVDYVGGYVVLKIMKNGLDCDTCLNCIQDPHRKSDLIDLKSKGFLKTPSQDLSDLLLKIETMIRDNAEKIFSPAFLPAVQDQVHKSGIKPNLFGGDDHSEDHKSDLVHYATALYLKIRLHHEATIMSEIDKYIRRSFTKLITHKHQ